MMDRSNMILGLIILTVLVNSLFVCMNKKMSNTDCALVVVGLVILVAVYITYTSFTPKKHHTTTTTAKEGFKADIDYKMGEYTGLDVNTDKMPYDGLAVNELIKPENIIYHSPVGEPHTLNMDKALECNNPSVSGKKAGPNAMFMLAYNRSSPDCCPATFSNSMGCVCMAPEQHAYLKRGGRVVE